MTDEFNPQATPAESTEPIPFTSDEPSPDAEAPMGATVSEEPPAPDGAQVLRDTRRAYSRCGWAVAALTLFLTIVLPVVIAVLTAVFKGNEGGAFYKFFEENLLYLNEVIIVIGILIGMTVLIGMPKRAPERKPVVPIVFLLFFVIGIAIGFAGNMRSSSLLSVWSTFTGLGMEDELANTLTSIDPLQMIVCTGILAPFIEEYFFRKLLIDRLYRYGELTAILFSGVAFALFHGNFDQLYYTLGLGLLFAYFYCRTGSYLGAVFLHMAFNFFSGVIPALLMMELPIETLESFLTAPSISVLQDTLVPMLLYLLYLTVYYGAVIVGIIFFFINLKKITVQKRETPLSCGRQTEAVLVNSGVLVALTVLVLQLLLSLFTA